MFLGEYLSIIHESQCHLCEIIWISDEKQDMNFRLLILVMQHLQLCGSSDYLSFNLYTVHFHICYQNCQQNWTLCLGLVVSVECEMSRDRVNRDTRHSKHSIAIEDHALIEIFIVHFICKLKAPCIYNIEITVLLFGIIKLLMIFCNLIIFWHIINIIIHFIH